MTQASGMRRAEKRLPPPASLASDRRHRGKKSAALEFGRPGGGKGRSCWGASFSLTFRASDAALNRCLVPFRPGPKLEAATCFPGPFSPGRLDSCWRSGGGGIGAAPADPLGRRRKRGKPPPPALFILRQQPRQALEELLPRDSRCWGPGGLSWGMLTESRESPFVTSASTGTAEKA